MGYLSAGATSIATRVGLAEDRLLQAVVWNDSHVLRGLFPPKNSRRPGLRARMHNFDLPCKDDKNYVSRVLYKHINRVPKATNNKTTLFTLSIFSIVLYLVSMFQVAVCQPVLQNKIKIKRIYISVQWIGNCVGDMNANNTDSL